MKRIGKVIFSAVLVLTFIACSNEADKSASETLAEKSKQMGAAVSEATEAATAAVEETVKPAMEKVAESVGEVADASKEVVTETIATATNGSSEESGEAASEGPTEHIVKGVITQWQPLVTYAQPGGTIRFTGMTGHDTASMEGMIPDGATSWHSKLGEEGFTITVDKEGGYVYKCTPHITTGMVGIIIVGDKTPANLAQLEENASSVKIGGNMVKRAIRKLKKQIAP